MGTDDALRAIAAEQQGLAAVRQAYELGLSLDAMQHRLARGDWARETTRVLRLVGSPHTDLASAMCSVLHHGPDCYVSHQAALALWGVPGFWRDPVHVLSRRSRNRMATTVGVVHSTTDLFDTHIASLQGVPIVTPIRAIFDIAGRTHPLRVERALDNAWARRLVTYALLHRTLGELAGRGRPGIRLLRALAAEIQSELFHGSVLDRRRDAERIAALRASGQEVLEMWETDVWRNPSKVVQDVRDACQRAARRRLS